jgi:glycosyltransferase involved in cell wall biosynthesis
VINLSVVMPVYNEAGVIESLVEDLGRELLPLVESLEVIVVDDASTDETPAILERLARDRPWLNVQRPERNAGHGPAVIRGLRLARAEWVFQIDSDGQFVVAEFARLWDRRESADLVLGVRTQRNDPLHRLLLSRTVRIATSLLAGRRIRDANTPFRLLRRAVWVDLEGLMAPETLAPNILVTLGAAVRGWRIVDVPVTHLPRERGVSSLRALRLVRFSLRGLRQLVGYRYRLARAPAPVRLAAEEPT